MPRKAAAEIMPTNLKSLLSRSRSKNELKLRESKDEISPSGNSKSGNSSDNAGSSCSICESSGNHACLRDACCCSASSTCNVTPNAGVNCQQLENDSSEGNFLPPASRSDLSHSSGEECPNSCIMPDNFFGSLNNETGLTMSANSMLPSSGNVFHNSCLASQQRLHHHQDDRCGSYSCCSPNYNAYEMADSTMVASGLGHTNVGGGDYCGRVGGGGGYYLDEKPRVACTSRRGGIMDQSDNNAEMRRNASCKTLFFSCTTLHQHPIPGCHSFESSHMEPTLEFPPGSCENPAGSCLTESGNGAAVSSSVKMPSLSHHHHHQTRTNMADDCGSLAYGSSSSSAACCTSNVKDGSPCQSLSLRKCETVLALSNFNGCSVSATTNPVTQSSAKTYIRNPSTGAPTYSNFPVTTSGTTGASQLSSSSALPSSNVGGKVKVMKEKIFSTSSSALNCLLHSSSRTGKLFSGWKLSSASNSSNSGSNSNIGHISNMLSGSTEGSNCLGVNCQANKHFLGTSCISTTPGASAAASSSTSESNKVGSSSSTRATGHHHHPHQKSRSQLSISENSFCGSPEPLTPVNRLRRNVSVNNTSSFCPTGAGSLSAHSSYSRSSSVASFGWKEKEDPFEQVLECRLCLYKVHIDDTMEIHACSCRYCKDVSNHFKKKWSFFPLLSLQMYVQKLNNLLRSTLNQKIQQSKNFKIA